MAEPRRSDSLPTSVPEDIRPLIEKMRVLRGMLDVEIVIDDVDTWSDPPSLGQGHEAEDIAVQAAWPTNNCSICWEDYQQCPREQLPCSHNFCRDCLQSYIAVQLEALKLEFTCPHRTCSEIIPHEAVAVQLQALSDAFRRAKRLNRQHNSVECPKCGLRVIRTRQELGDGVPGGAAVRHRCTNEECGILFCLRCGENYRGHAGVACMDHSSRKRTLRERFWLKFRRVKPCPNCLIYCMKNGGCDWVKCAQCAHEFCWKCLFPHSHSHHVHRWGITDADVRRHERKVKAAKALAVAGAVVAAPPVIVVGGVAAILVGIVAIPVSVVVLPVLGVRKCYRVRTARGQYVRIDL